MICSSLSKSTVLLIRTLPVCQAFSVCMVSPRLNCFVKLWEFLHWTSTLIIFLTSVLLLKASFIISTNYVLTGTVTSQFSLCCNPLLKYKHLLAENKFLVKFSAAIYEFNLCSGLYCAAKWSQQLDPLFCLSTGCIPKHVVLSTEPAYTSFHPPQFP